MNRVRGEGADMPRDRAPPGEGETDFAVGRAGDRPEQVGRDDFDLVPAGTQFAHGRLERADDAVDLGLPGVGADQYPHAARAEACRRSEEHTSELQSLMR